MSEQQPPKKQTDFLNLPTGSELSDREISPARTFPTGARLQLRIDNQKIIVDVKEQIVVGRSVEGDSLHKVDIDLSPQGGYQAGVSRKHALVRRREEALYIQDLKSTNGTRINGSHLAPDREYPLRDGDEVEFGRVRSVIRFLPPE
jgi:pSer/pThr/pTyr-binding forkhead associated (FHA) protein